MFKKHKASNELKKRFAEIGEIPKELITSYSRMVLLDNSEFTIENYSGIIEYEQNSIKLKSANNVIIVLGENLTINELGNDDLYIKGKIKNIQIEGDE